MVYEYLSKIIPKKLRKEYIDNIKYSAFKVNPDKFIGFAILFGLALSLVIAIDVKLIFGISFFLSLIGVFIFIEVSIYFWILLKVDAKAKFVENVLPDALQLMSSNLRAGITTDRALLLSARPEFGPLKDEINRVGKEIATGRNIGDALMGMNERIKSDKLLKTTELIVSGLKSGGSLASLLDQTSKNLRQQNFTDERIRSNVMMYVIFIFVAVGVGSPVLFGLSSYLVEVFSSILGSVDVPDTAVSNIRIGISLTEISITPGFIVLYSVVSLLASSLMGSLIIGLISKGKERKGIKFIPVFVLMTLGLFFLSRFLISKILGGLIGT